MRIPWIILWILIGWIKWWPWPPWPPPLPGPDPPPPWLIIRIIGVAGAVIGGWLFTQLFAGPQPEPPLSLVSTAATAVGAFVGAAFAVDTYGLLRGKAK